MTRTYILTPGRATHMWNKRRKNRRNPTTRRVRRRRQAARGAKLRRTEKGDYTVSSMPGGRFEPEARGSATIGKAVKDCRPDFQQGRSLRGWRCGRAPWRLWNTSSPSGPTAPCTPPSRRAKWWRWEPIQGNVEATDKIEIRKDAKLVGDIRTARIIIEDGAYFKGSIDIVKPEPAQGRAQAASRLLRHATRAGGRRRSASKS